MASVAEELIERVVDGEDAGELVEAIKRTAMRPRKRRFGRRRGINPITGKRKDPRRRLIARKAARKGRAKRKASQRRFNRSAKGKRFHKKLGKLVARIRRI